MVSSPSIHLQRLAMLAEGVYSTDAPKSAGGIHHQLNTKGGSVERTIGTQMPVFETNHYILLFFLSGILY